MSYEPDTLEGIRAFCEREGQPCSSLRVRVWVVEPCEYDAYGIMGVYESLEAAKASMRYEWELTERGWYTVGADAMTGGYHAYEAPVRTLAEVLAE